MVAQDSKSVNLPLAPLSAALLGLAAALGVAAMPVETLEALVMDSGIAAIFHAAEPPLGFTARAILAAGAGGIAALLGWFIAFILVGTRGLTIGEEDIAEGQDEPVARTPVIRRADAHPDAPPRPPLLATRDLGTPFLDIRAADNENQPSAAKTVRAEPLARPVEQALPDDLSQPLAAFDPGSIPEVALPRPVPVAPLNRGARPAVFDESERFEVFELTPPVRTPPPRMPDFAPAPARDEAIVRPETDASVHALLERLERGVIRKGLSPRSEAAPRPRDAERGLEEALVTLRNLARRA